MHGTIIHYDPLTQCGLLRTEAGQVQYFRLDEVVSQGRVATGQPVALRNGVLVDTGGSQQDASLPMRPPQRLNVQATAAPVATQVRSAGRSIGWIGAVLALGALILLMLSGGEQSGYSSPNPRLVESTFGMAASILLVLEAIFFISSVGSRRRIRWTFWLIVWSSLFAYVGRTFDGFEADDATGWYAYALLTLGFAVYILPYRSK
ncbi:MAG: hypothetical protein EOO39_11945 [Cytophagaceae bacterium]|nr:MAG: hypothetical protein EOO39_11945 [Cytophagaceae bacterium]